MTARKSAIYLRKSRAEEGIEALKTHKQVLSRRAAELGLEVDIYEEIGSSVSMEVRDELNRMLARIEEYENVLVMDIDRLSRSLADMEYIKNLFIEKDVKIVTPNQVIDLSIEAQNMMVDFQSVIAKAEYQQIRKRMRIGKLEGARKGHWVSANTPLGYEYDRKTKHLKPNAIEMPLVREIFNLALENMTPTQIARELNDRGYTTRKGNPFSSDGVLSILTNQAYIGYVIYRENPKVKARKATEVITPNSHTAIISELDFLEVQRLIQSRKKNHGRNTLILRSFLQGLVFCKDCGRQMPVVYHRVGSGGRKSESLVFGACRGGCDNQGIACQEVEREIVIHLKALRNSLEGKLKTLRATDTSSLEKDLQTLIKQHKENIKKYEKRLDNLLDLQLDGEISKEQYANKRAKIENDLQKSKQEIKRLELSIASLDTETQQEKIRYAIKMLDNIRLMPIEEANRFLKSIIGKIYYSRPKAKGIYRRAKAEAEIIVEPIEAM
ncbi:recombinase family protein [Neobacillus vireti]|uniref:recombinase family protein n=1 Tax=Neobacillus vireti TaxID=220686 RepID=UPI002FFD7814